MTEAEPVAEVTIAQALARLAEIAAQGQEVQKAQLKQTAKKSNEFGPDISPYNPRGEKDFPMPLLKCDFYCPWKMSPTYHAFDREEVELCNLLEPGNYVIDMTDDSKQAICVVGVKNSNTGALEKMSLLGPQDDQGTHTSLFTNENKQNFPPFRNMLRQMIGEPAEAVMTMKREILLIKAGELEVSKGE